MGRSFLRWCLWRWCVLSVFWVLCSVQAQAADSRQDVLPAHPLVELAPHEVIELREACLTPDQGSLTPPSESANWLHTALPHLWKDTHPGYEGTMWYRFRVHVKEVPDRNWGVYLPRVVMNAQVWVNGQPLGYTGSMKGTVTRNWYVPLLTAVQPVLWKTGENVIYIRVASGFVSRNGLAPIQVGPLELVAKTYERRFWLQVEGVRVANVALMALGVFMLIVWSRDREQSAIGFMGLAAMTWAASTLMGVAATPHFDLLWWENLNYTLAVVSQLLLCLFYIRFAGVRRLWVDVPIYSMMVILPLYGVLAPRYWVTTLLFGMIYVTAIASMAAALWHVIRHRRKDGGWLILGCLALLPAGAHDVMIMTGQLPFDTVYWLYFAGPLVMICNTVIVAGDHARSRHALNDLNRNLADRVAEREAALRESFERLAALERSQAVSAERSRILKDMHDGVGAHLTSALRQLQTSNESSVDVPLVAQTLRDSLDQLKLSIDALSLQSGDVEGLLASWRFRLAPRLKAAGIDLVWDVERLPPWPAGNSPELRQLQYILFEGLSNVLQHSGATRLVLSARDLGHHIRVSLIDNGHGWHTTSGPFEGQGLQTMRSRAATIGARMEFLPSSNGGLELRLSLPLIDLNEQSDLSSVA
jgi:signal transduction histidine kinase